MMRSAALSVMSWNTFHSLRHIVNKHSMGGESKLPPMFLDFSFILYPEVGYETA